MLSASFNGSGSFEKRGRDKNKPRPLGGRGKVSYTSVPGHIQALAWAEKGAAITFCRLFFRLLMLFHDRF